MPYIVTNSDGSTTVTVSDGVVDTSTYSLALVGRNVSNYGQYFAQNTIRHLENFASTTSPSPSTRLIGQVWYDKTEQVLRVWDGTNWKRATGTLVGPASSKPTSSLGGGGTQFFNTTTNKLEVYNGSKFVDASYPGSITGASDDPSAPALHGSRLRTIFLTDDTGRKHPVIALCYVKSGAPNQGSTQIGTGGQYETIMTLVADEQFTVADAISTVDGVSVNYYNELISVGGIAAARSGRAAGLILAGPNQRSEYSSAAVADSDTIFANTIGSASDPVSTMHVQELTVLNSIDITSGSTTVNDLDANGSITVGGDVTAATGIGTFANLIVTANTTLSGVTNINGTLNVNGVNTQAIGTDAQKIETYFGNDINTQTLTVDDTATVTNTLNVGNIVCTNNIGAHNITASGNTALYGTTVTTLGATGAVDLGTGGLLVGAASTFQGNINAAGHTITASVFNGAVSQVNVTDAASLNGTFYITLADGTGAQDIQSDAEFTYNPNTNLMSVTNIGATAVTATGTVTANLFSGTATSARYADLAEIYASDAEYAPGTVVKLGGSEEITQTESHADTEVFGVISTNPAYLMNKDAQGLPVAMTGRVPVKVIGKVKKGERLVSSDVPGVAWALGEDAYDARAIIGRSLQDKNDGDINIIEAVIGVK